MTEEFKARITEADDWNRTIPILLLLVSESLRSRTSVKSRVNVLTSWKFAEPILPDASRTKTVSVVNVQPAE